MNRASIYTAKKGRKKSFYVCVRINIVNYAVTQRRSVSALSEGLT